MPVPTSMNDLSVTESSNSPAGSDAISTSLDNYLRAIQGIVRTTNHKGSDIASAAAVAIGAATGEFVTVTGTTTITSFDSISAGIVRDVHFSGALTLTNSSNLQMPGGFDYETTAGDVLRFRSLGSGNWRCVGVLRYGQVGKARITKKRTSNALKSSTTTMVADDQLTGFTILPNKIYKIKAFLRCSVGNVKLGIREDSSGTLADLQAGVSNFSSTFTGGELGVSTEWTTSAVSVSASVKIDGFVAGDTVATRSISLFWAQASSNPTASRINTGSWMEVEEV